LHFIRLPPKKHSISFNPTAPIVAKRRPSKRSEDPGMLLSGTQNSVAKRRPSKRSEDPGMLLSGTQNSVAQRRPSKQSADPSASWDPVNLVFIWGPKNRSETFNPERSRRVYPGGYLARRGMKSACGGRRVACPEWNRRVEGPILSEPVLPVLSLPKGQRLMHHTIRPCHSERSEESIENIVIARPKAVAISSPCHSRASICHSRENGNPYTCPPFVWRVRSAGSPMTPCASYASL